MSTTTRHRNFCHKLRKYKYNIFIKLLQEYIFLYIHHDSELLNFNLGLTCLDFSYPNYTNFFDSCLYLHIMTSIVIAISQVLFSK